MPFYFNLYLFDSLSSDLKPGKVRLARSNYSFNKRQKELARKKKKEQKRQSKLDKKTIKPEEDSD